MTVYSDSYLAGGQYLVTGASSGIGKETAALIAQCGGRVIAAGRDPERLAALVDGLPGDGHAASANALVNADQTADWVKSLVAEHGTFNGVFHAAGVESVRPVRLTKQEHIDGLMASSLFAAFGIARAMSQRGALADGGSLVFMSSVAGASGQSGMSLYSAAKAGIDGLVRSLACEFAPRQVRVNSVAAGAIQTPMHERLTRSSTGAAIDAYEQSHLLGFGTAADVANAALFLLGPASRWVTGTSMVIDGGYLCR
jgi:NAD(P)-dependent dehydrogenase (short-subunit alcohol dehydrogenase family)